MNNIVSMIFDLHKVQEPFSLFGCIRPLNIQHNRTEGLQRPTDVNDLTQKNICTKSTGFNIVHSQTETTSLCDKLLIDFELRYTYANTQAERLQNIILIIHFLCLETERA